MPNKTNKKGIFFYVKLLVSVGLIFFLFQKVGWDALWTTARQANLMYLLLYVAIGVLAVLISSFKWYCLAHSQSISVSHSKFFLLYLVGFFFNHVLPTSIGGDVVRIYELGKITQNKAQAAASVFMERFTGLTALLLFALCAILMSPAALKDPRLLPFFCLIISCYILGVWLIFNRSAFSFINEKVSIKFLNRIFKKIQKVQDAIQCYQDHPKTLWIAMGLSVSFYVLAVFGVYFGCLTFNAAPSLADLFFAVPIMLLIFLMPISIGGIGLQEWSFYFVLTKIGVPMPAAISLGLLFRIRTLFFGSIGGVLYPLVTGSSFKNIKSLKGEQAESIKE